MFSQRTGYKASKFYFERTFHRWTSQSASQGAKQNKDKHTVQYKYKSTIEQVNNP